MLRKSMQTFVSMTVRIVVVLRGREIGFSRHERVASQSPDVRRIFGRSRCGLLRQGN
jgi:hypothetical protein